MPNPIITTPGEIEDWDRIVQSHPDYSVFHSREWMETIAQSYGYTPQSIVVRDAQRAHLVPFFETRGILGARRAICLPYSDEANPLTHDQTIFDAIWNFLLKTGRRINWRYVELRGGAKHLASAPPWSEFYSHQLGLNSGCESVRSKFSPAIDRGIRKAATSGLEVRHSRDFESVKAYFHLHCLTRKKQGVPPQPFRFFENLHKHLINPGLGFITLAFHKKIPAAGAVFLKYGQKAIYKFGASDPHMLKHRPNNAVIWKAIQHLIESGYDSLGFGRTDLHHSGLRRFKLGWGAKESRIHYFRYSLALQTFLCGKEARSNRPVLCAVFSKIPLCLQKWIGAKLYRYAS